MKKLILFFSILFAITLFSCKDSATDAVITPNFCLPEAISINDTNFLSLRYDGEYKKLQAVTLTGIDGDLTTTFTYNKDNKIETATTDNLVQTFTYTGNNITKVVMKEDKVIIGEKTITYNGNNIAKMEEFTIDGTAKVLSLAYTFEYDGNSNVKKINTKMPDFVSKEFPFFEGTTYSENLSEFAALSKYNQALFISNAELFTFLPSHILGNLLSKNIVSNGKLSFSIVEILFGSLLGGELTEAEILKSIGLIAFKNTIKTNEKGFVNSNSTVFGTGADQNTLKTTVNYYCN
jgi:hypothetical protein